jgi:hypothetical protein
MQAPHEVAVQNGKLSAGSKWRTLGVLPPDCNQTTRATWQHSYGNKIGCLAQGMPGRNTSTNTIVFIKKNQVPQNRAKDVTYGLITWLIRPEKIEEPNQKGWLQGATEYTTQAMQAHQLPTYLQSSSSLTVPSALLTQNI